MIHSNSLSAFHSEQPKLSKRAEAIYAWILERGPRTDREVMQGMGFPDMNNVRPRITELVKSRRLMEVCSRVCAVTGKPVRVVDISRARQILLPLDSGIAPPSVQSTSVGQAEGISHVLEIA